MAARDHLKVTQLLISDITKKNTQGKLTRVNIKWFGVEQREIDFKSVFIVVSYANHYFCVTSLNELEPWAQFHRAT